MRLFILILLIGTLFIAIMADSAHPGSYLYQVKIYGNEKVIEAFSIGKQARAENSLRMLSHRIGDIRYLVADPSLVPVYAPLIKKSIGESQAQVESYVNSQEALDPDIASYNDIVRSYNELMSRNQAVLSSFYRETIDYP